MNKNPSLIEAKVSQPGEDFLTESSKSPASMAFFVKQKALRKNLRAEERQTGLEPATSTLARWRTTNCTTIAYKIEERQTGLEPATSTLARWRTTNCTTIAYKIERATDGTRTRDLHLGKVAYYQLYYYRI